MALPVHARILKEIHQLCLKILIFQSSKFIPLNFSICILDVLPVLTIKQCLQKYYTTIGIHKIQDQAKPLAIDESLDRQMNSPHIFIPRNEFTLLYIVTFHLQLIYDSKLFHGYTITYFIFICLTTSYYHSTPCQNSSSLLIPFFVNYITS